MNQLTLVITKECFETLDTGSYAFSRQYENNLNCPIAEAATRQFKDSCISVNPSGITINGTYYKPLSHYLLEEGYLGIESVRAIARALETQSKVMLKFKPSFS